MHRVLSEVNEISEVASSVPCTSEGPTVSDLHACVILSRAEKLEVDVIIAF